MPTGDQRHLTLNEVVAQGLFHARALREWTQSQAAERIAPYLGKTWSKAVYSAAEWPSKRTRQFTADDLYAFARGFDLPITFFLIPHEANALYSHAGSDEAGSTAAEVLDLVFSLGEDAREELDSEVELSPAGALAIRRWAIDHYSLVEKREEREEELLRAARALDQRGIDERTEAQQKILALAKRMKGRSR